jgi:hypothetical protein
MWLAMPVIFDDIKPIKQREQVTVENKCKALNTKVAAMGVEGFALIVHQGRTHGLPALEKELLYPALHGVKRIIWIGAHGHLTGTMTLAAAAWCQREGIHLCILDSAGMPILEMAPADAPHDAAVRRVQWLVSSGVTVSGSPRAGAI